MSYALPVAITVRWVLLIQCSKVVGYFPIQQTDRNGHIYIRVMKQHMTQTAQFSRKS